MSPFGACVAAKLGTGIPGTIYFGTIYLQVTNDE
jgi:hypothetical protein